MKRKIIQTTIMLIDTAFLLCAFLFGTELYDILKQNGAKGSDAIMVIAGFEGLCFTAFCIIAEWGYKITKKHKK